MTCDGSRSREPSVFGCIEDEYRSSILTSLVESGDTLRRQSLRLAHARQETTTVEGSKLLVPLPGGWIETSIRVSTTTRFLEVERASHAALTSLAVTRGPSTSTRPASA